MSLLVCIPLAFGRGGAVVVCLVILFYNIFCCFDLDCLLVTHFCSSTFLFFAAERMATIPFYSGFHTECKKSVFLPLLSASDSGTANNET